MRFGLLLAAAFAFAQTPTPKSLTIEQLMSAPFPSAMTAAPSGGHVAWVQNAAGVRNIWVAMAPDYAAAKAITSYKNDDGLEISSLAWTAEASAIVFVRGAVDEPAVWVVPAAGGEAKKLGEGSAPEVSKSGRVVWISKGQVWSAPADASAKAEQLFKVRGTASSLRWSPDRNQLAFANERGDHGFIGVYDTAAKSVSFLAR